MTLENLRFLASPKGKVKVNEGEGMFRAAGPFQLPEDLFSRASSLLSFSSSSRICPR